MKLMEVREVREFVEAVKSVDLNLDNLYNEVDMLHTTRRVHRFDKKLSPSSIRSANAIEIAHRSRLLKIYVDCKTLYDDLREMEKLATLELVVNNIAILPYKTKTDCNTYLHGLFRKKLPALRQLKKIVEYAELVIKDIDEGNWKQNNIVRSFELETRPEVDRSL